MLNLACYSTSIYYFQQSERSFHRECLCVTGEEPNGLVCYKGYEHAKRGSFTSWMSDLKRLRISTFAGRRNAGNPISPVKCYVIWKSCFVPFLRKSSTVMESIRKNSRARPLARCPRRFNVAMFQRSARCRFIYARLASSRNIRRVPDAKSVPARQIIAHDQFEFSLLCDFSKPARLAGYFNLGETNVSWAYRLPHGIVPRRHKQALWVFADRLPSTHARNDAVENEHFARGRADRVRETYLKRVRKRERSFSRCRSA